MDQIELLEEAENCRRKALAYLGQPETIPSLRKRHGLNLSGGVSDPQPTSIRDTRWDRHGTRNRIAGLGRSECGREA
jgi:hypothetical protein